MNWARLTTRIVLLEREVAEKDRCIQELSDSLMLRVIKANKQPFCTNHNFGKRRVSCNDEWHGRVDHNG